ncbi:MAG: tRNA 4-thiouridine(8) synthase ThiI, partial [bacterium (Candidatus Ratteibacteria) CG15_BIG_FIL_POST_REV_8_21_14_020_41_12]
PPTVPEEMGIVDREKLLNISGRSRKPQMALARDYKIGNYPCPAGGCLLTDPGFARRMKDLMTHSEITLNDIELLKVGRHFRLSSSAKIVAGRNKEENERMIKLSKPGDLCFEPQEVKGPIGIGRGDFDQITITLASQIMARYSDGNAEVGIAYQRLPDGEKSLLRAKSMKDSELRNFRI